MWGGPDGTDEYTISISYGDIPAFSTTFTAYARHNLTKASWGADSFARGTKVNLRWRASTQASTRVIIENSHWRAVRVVDLGLRKWRRNQWTWNGRLDDGTFAKPGKYVAAIFAHTTYASQLGGSRLFRDGIKVGPVKLTA